MDDGTGHRTWNIFRRRHAHGLCCAVPADLPIPTFLMTADWTYGFQFTRGDAPVPGFSLPSAEIGARFNGFYLFLGFGGADARPAAFPDERRQDAEPKEPLAHSPGVETRASS